MMPTGAYHAIDTLPAPEARTLGTLLDAARPLPESVARMMGDGIEWTPLPDVVVNREATGCSTEYEKDPRDIGSLVNQKPFLLWDRLRCSTAGLELSWLVDAARLGIDEMVSAQLALELEDAAGSGGIGLIGNATYTPAVVTTGAVQLRTAIAELEGYLAEEAGAGKPGMRGVIHLTPGLLAVALGDGFVEYRDGKYRTATGHIVIGDAGHTGQETPFGASAPSAGQAWIYATGDIFYVFGNIPQLSVTDPNEPDAGPVYIGRNQNQPLLERAGLIAFDPNVLGAALVTTTSSSGGGGGDASAENQALIIAELEEANAKVASASVDAVADNTSTAVELAAANSDRVGLSITNDAGSSGILYVKLGASAAATDYTVPIAAGGYWELPWPYTGVVTGIWASDGDGTAYVTEV